MAPYLNSRRKVLAVMSPPSRKVDKLVLIWGEGRVVCLCLALTLFVGCGQPATIVLRGSSLDHQIRVVYEVYL